MYHAVDERLLVHVEDGDEHGLLVAAAFHGRVEVHGVSVVIVVADVFVLSPAGVTATLRS